MKNVLPILAALVAVTGCMNERAYVDPQANAAFGSGSAQNNVNLASGQIRGDFGPRKGFDGPATDIQGNSDPEWRTSTVTVARAEQVRGTGMVILWTNGITLENLDVGTHDFTYDATSLETPPVSMNVCSGSDSSSIDFDRPVDHVTATVTQQPQGRLVQLHTETKTIDPNTGETTDAIETSDTSFVVNNAATAQN